MIANMYSACEHRKVALRRCKNVLFVVGNKYIRGHTRLGAGHSRFWRAYHIISDVFLVHCALRAMIVKGILEGLGHGQLKTLIIVSFSSQSPYKNKIEEDIEYELTNQNSLNAKMELS